MDNQQLQRFRERLLRERARLQEDVQRLDARLLETVRPQGELSDLPTHPADRDVEGLDERLTVEHTLRGELRAINEALERLEAGTYGTCQRCGGPIALERLDAIPFTSYCIDCETAIESASS